MMSDMSNNSRSNSFLVSGFVRLGSMTHLMSLSELWARAWHLFRISLGYQIINLLYRLRGLT
jgi:hypothetical protein